MAKHGTFYWNELTSGNVKRSLEFYGKLIGWKSEEMPMPDGTYTLVKPAAAEPPAGGLFKSPKGFGPTDMWIPYVQVDDVDATAAKVKKLRGNVMKPPFDVPGVGRICLITDPGGAMLGLITPVPMETPAPKAKPKSAKAASKAKPKAGSAGRKAGRA